MEASEQTKINQIKLRHQNEIARCKNEIAELREANKVLMKRINGIEQTSCQTENAENKSINRLMEENEGLKLDIASKDKEYVKVKIELDNLSQKNERALNEIQRLRNEVNEWKSKIKTIEEDAMTRNKGRK